MKPTDLHSGLTHERLFEVIKYDPLLGTFVWTGRGRVKKGQRGGKAAGHFMSRTGYVNLCIDGHAYLAHRVAWFYMTKKWPAYYVDHINGVGSDNRWANLREATQQQNSANQNRLRKNNTSGYRGVSYDPMKGWSAVISVGGINRRIGSYKTPEEAKAVYDFALKEVFGDFAKTDNLEKQPDQRGEILYWPKRKR